MTIESRTQTVVVAAPKSVGIAVILTALLGPLGMFYSTVLGGIVMLVATVFLAVITFFVGGLGALLAWPICIIWGAIAASSYNKNLTKNTKRF